MSKLLIRLVINAAALWVASALIPDIRFAGEGSSPDVVTLLVVALIFGLINALIKPIVQLVTCPAYVITLGLFTFVVNALMLLLTSFIAQQVGSPFIVAGFLPALLGGIVISIVSTLLSLFLSDNND